jgi:hypothetical protein
MAKYNILIIGCGPHARTFYMPTFRKLAAELDAEIVVAVDLNQNRQVVETFLKKDAPHCRGVFVEACKDKLDGKTAAILDDIVKENKIDGVIVSTDPLNHKIYADWCLSRSLHLLLDKPITTQPDAALDLKQADKVEQDYNDLLQTYNKALLKKETAFLVCCHRRYHPGLDAALKLIMDMSQQTGCPVTNIHSYHCDGQWRFPGEMITQSHHSYYDGHGKVSHSGYHFIDSVVRFWQAGLASGKSADRLEIFSSFVRPRGLIKQLHRQDYVRLFGSKYETVNPISDDELSWRFERFGEIDAEVNATFISENEPIALATISLLHNGFSRRSWMLPGEDLYKGNGRVKHEQHRIHLGPFMCIQIHSYQSKDKHDTCNADDLAVGGNNHFEMIVFRNTGIVGGNPVERFALSDLIKSQGYNDNELHIHRIKEGAVREFIDFIDGKISRNQMHSDISDHKNAVRIMSAIYRSFILRNNNENPVVSLPFNKT